MRYILNVVLLLTLFSLTGCRDISITDRPYQRVLVSDFSTPLRTLLPARNAHPNTLTLRVSGTISQPVILVVDQLTVDKGRYNVRRDTLSAGTYTNKVFSDDYYSKDETELVITGAPSATGSLVIEWYRQ